VLLAKNLTHPVVFRKDLRTQNKADPSIPPGIKNLVRDTSEEDPGHEDIRVEDDPHGAARALATARTTGCGIAASTASSGETAPPERRRPPGRRSGIRQRKRAVPTARR